MTNDQLPQCPKCSRMFPSGATGKTHTRLAVDAPGSTGFWLWKWWWRRMGFGGQKMQTTWGVSILAWPLMTEVLAFVEVRNHKSFALLLTRKVVSVMFHNVSIIAELEEGETDPCISFQDVQWYVAFEHASDCCIPLSSELEWHGRGTYANVLRYYQCVYLLKKFCLCLCYTILMFFNVFFFNEDR